MDPKKFQCTREASFVNRLKGVALGIDLIPLCVRISVRL